jgi:hypothetical protein
MRSTKRGFTAKSSLFVARTTLIRSAQPDNNPTLVFVQKLTSDGGMDGPEEFVDGPTTVRSA